MNLVPTTDLARRVAALCKRRPNTPWAPKEVSVYRRLVKSGFFNNLADLELVEQYYAFERRKGEHGPNRGLHRRDLYTFLNNAPGELDRATQWREAHPIVKPPRKIIPIELPSDQPPLVLTEDDQQAVAKFMEHFTAFKRVKAEMGR